MPAAPRERSSFLSHTFTKSSPWRRAAGVALGFAVVALGAGTVVAAEPALWTRPVDQAGAEASGASYYSWDIFQAASNPVFAPDVANLGPAGATLTASGNYIVTSSSNIYGLPSISLSLPGYGASTEGYTTVFLQSEVVIGSAGSMTNFRLTAGGMEYTPQVSSGGGLYFQVGGQFSSINLSFAASVDHTSLESVSVDILYSGIAPDLGSLSTGGGGRTVVPGGSFSSLGFGYSQPIKRAPSTLGSLYYSGAVNDSGVGVHTAVLSVGGISRGTRAVRSNPDGQIQELATLGTAADGTNSVQFADINNAGDAVGQVQKYVGGVNKGFRGVVWDAETGAVTELATLGSTADGSASSQARDINESGAIAGRSTFHNAAGTQLSNNAVRWEAGTHTATNLGVGDAYAINNAGVVVGVSGQGSAARPARWDAGSSTPVLLASTTGLAMAIGESGVITGYVGPANAQVATRWDAGSTTGTALLRPTSFTGGTNRNAGVAVDAVGNIVGYASRSTATGTPYGEGAVLWKIGETVGVALDTIGVNGSGLAGQSFALDLNNAGYIVGSVDAFDETGLSLGFRAVVWDFEGNVIDLNTLLDPGSGWVLTQAQEITDTGWISGVGSFSSSDGTYERSFTFYAPEFAVVPEPQTAVLVLASVACLVRRRRKG
jgi:hypothetical protein